MPKPRPYRCPHCVGRSFTSASALAMHVRAKHEHEAEPLKHRSKFWVRAQLFLFGLAAIWLVFLVLYVVEHS